MQNGVLSFILSLYKFHADHLKEASKSSIYRHTPQISTQLRRHFRASKRSFGGMVCGSVQLLVQKMQPFLTSSCMKLLRMSLRRRLEDGFDIRNTCRLLYNGSLCYKNSFGTSRLYCTLSANLNSLHHCFCQHLCCPLWHSDTLLHSFACH